MKHVHGGLHWSNGFALIVLLTRHVSVSEPAFWKARISFCGLISLQAGAVKWLSVSVKVRNIQDFTSYLLHVNILNIVVGCPYQRSQNG